jgi:hypothetical protein
LYKKKSVITGFCIILAMLVCILEISASCTGKCNYVGNGFNIRTSRDFIDVSDSGASGKVGINSITTSNGLNNVKLTIDVKGINPYKGKCKIVYEAWLVDKDTGYSLSLGAFTPNRAGKFYQIFQQKQVNFLVYDYVVIAKKQINSPYPDSGDIVLLADITGNL